MKTRRRQHVFLSMAVAGVLLLTLFGSSAEAHPGSSAGRSVCDSCACLPDNVAPVTINCTCNKTKLLIFRDQDASLMSSVRELTLASCGFVALPSTGLSSSTQLARVIVRDMKLFHYTAGLFPALESLSVEDVGELVLDGFGSANRTLRYLTLRRINVLRLVKGTVTTGAPLRRVLFDRVEVEEIESGALDMTFVGEGENSQAATDGFTVVDSTIKSVQPGGVTVRAGVVRILNSTLDDLQSEAVIVDDVKGSGVRLSGNRLGALVGDSVSMLRSPDGGDVQIDGNEFHTLPADMQLFKSERPVEFRDNIVENVDLGPFLFGVGPTVRVFHNRFECDCDPRRISVLKINQVFPGLLPDMDNRLSHLLSDNYCRNPVANGTAAADTTLEGYRDLLIKEEVCKGTNVTTSKPPAPHSEQPFWDKAQNSGSRHAVGTAILLANVFLLFNFIVYN